MNFIKYSFRRHCLSPMKSLKLQTASNWATLMLGSTGQAKKEGRRLQLDYSAVRDDKKSGTCQDGWVQVGAASLKCCLSLIGAGSFSVLLICLPLHFRHFPPFSKCSFHHFSSFQNISFHLFQSWLQVGLRCIHLVRKPLSWQAAENECRWC